MTLITVSQFSPCLLIVSFLFLRILCLLLFLPALSATQAATATCYCKDASAVSSSCANAVPCGNDTSRVQQCCIAGHQCHPDGFCYTGAPPPDLVTFSSFYMGGCTDPNFEDPVCPQQCTDLENQQVTYKNSTSQWACCFASLKVNCSAPSNETFPGPPPNQLISLPYDSNTTTTPPTSSPTISAPISPSTTSSPVSSSSSSSSSPPSSSSELTAGAKAGIGVGVAVGAVIMIAAAIFAFMRSKKAKERGMNKIYEVPNERGVYEIAGKMGASELAGERKTAELYADNSLGGSTIQSTNDNRLEHRQTSEGDSRERVELQ